MGDHRCTCLCHKDITSIHILRPASLGWHWRWTSQTVLTDSKQQSNSHRHERNIIPKDITKSTMFVDRKRGGGEGGERDALIHFPHSFLLNVAFFCLWVCLSAVMINTARHGKRVAVTMEGVVSLSLSHGPAVSPVTASQAHLAGPWEPAAGVQEGK